MDIANIIQTILIYALPVIFAITIHEAAHGYVARYFGDNTAWALGRVTLNPIKHIDPVGTVLIPLIVLWLFDGKFVFGYAKPVPVNFNLLRNSKSSMIWVALAGPASNFIQAILWALLIYVLFAIGTNEPFFTKMAQAGVLVNLVMWAFNLFPLPPLDGGRVLAGLLPRGGPQDLLARIEPFGFFIVMGLVIAGVLGNWWLRPLMALGYDAINLVLTPLTALLR